MACSGWLCGVDISQDRLAATATVLRKYRAVHSGVAQADWRLQLFCTDGTRFLARADSSSESVHACPTCPLRALTAELAEEVADSTCRLVLDSWVENVIRKTGVLHKGLPPPVRSKQLENMRQQRRKHFGVSRCDCVAPDPGQHWCCCVLSRESATEESRERVAGEASGIFDRVLVDAECTHDGSVKHLAKFATQWGWDSFERRVLDPGRLSGLQALQRGLLRCVDVCAAMFGTLCYTTLATTLLV